jgi:glycosyltransferase involved in cell wall biosynthesis
MKLLFAIKSLTAIGGAERVFCVLVGELIRRGHEVIVVTFDRPGTPSFYPLNVSVRRLDLGIGNTGQRARFIETLCRIAELRNVVKSERPYVAVGFMHSMFVPLSLALIGLRVPVVGSEHIVPEHYGSRPLEFALFMISAPLLCKITVLSEAIRDRYPRLIRRRMIAMPNPVIAASGRARPADDKPCYILLSVGRLDPQKDQATLIQAFRNLAATWPEWNLKILGEGPLRGELLAKVESLGLEGRVILPGATSNIAAEYRDADVFVLPSRYEAFGLVTVEAMSYGLPVVGFADCSGTNELIEDGINGYLVVPAADRVASLAQVLARLFGDPSLRLRMGESGMRKVTRMGSIFSVGDLWENLLNTVQK